MWRFARNHQAASLERRVDVRRECEGAPGARAVARRRCTMGHEVRPFAKIAAAQDAAIAPIVDRARVKLEPRRSRRKARALVLLIAAALAVSIALVVRDRKPEALSFEIEARRGVVKEWVLATHETPLRFSDGTTVLLGPESRGSVAETSELGARVAIARGNAAVSIAPRRDATWIFDVGPFAIAGGGTRFDASWEPAR